MKHQSQKQRDGDVWVPHRPAAGKHLHVKKHQKRDKGLEVVFDPKAHKDYLTGFHKRKVARRKEALKKLEKRQREQRLEERAERRQAMKEEMKRLGANLSDSEGEGGEEEEEEELPEQKVYTKGELVNTVTIMPIKVHSDSEDDLPAGESQDDEDERADDAERQQQQQQQQPWRRQGQTHGGEDEQAEQQQQQPGRKLSKTALRIMTKTKLKIEGKKAGFGGKSGGASKKGGKGGGGGKKGGGKRGGKGGGRGRR